MYTHDDMYIYVYIISYDIMYPPRNTGGAPTRKRIGQSFFFSLLSAIFQTRSGFKRFGFRELKPDCVWKRTESNEKSLFVVGVGWVYMVMIYTMIKARDVTHITHMIK